MDGAINIRVTIDQSSTPLDATVITQDRANDIAVLQVSNPNEMRAYPRLASSTAKDGERVYTIGHPLSGEMGPAPRVGEGIVSAAVGLDGDPRILHVTVPVHPGNSGGPLFSGTGEIVGIITARLRDEYLFRMHGVVPQGINFAVKASYLRPLLETIPACSGCSRLELRADLSAMDLIAEFREYVAYIEIGK